MMKNLPAVTEHDRLHILGEYPLRRHNLSQHEVDKNRLAFKTQNLFVLKVMPTKSNAQGLTKFEGEK